MSTELLAQLRRVESYLDSRDPFQPAACYMRDFQNNRHFWSPEAFSCFGLPVAEQAPPMEQFIACIVTPQRAEMIAAVRRHVKEGGRFVCEYRLRQPGGAIKHLRSTGQTIPNRTGDGVALMGTLLDLTEHHHACEALQKAFEMLQRLDPSTAESSAYPCDHLGILADSAGSGPAEQHANTDTETARLAGGSGGLSARQFSRVCELMKGRLREPLCVAEMAAAAGLSPAHFARAFKHTTGKSPHRFMIELRLERARSTLRSNSNGKLANVAIDFGFFDHSHFTRHFRRKFGVTPVDFMRQSAIVPDAVVKF